MNSRIFQQALTRARHDKRYGEPMTGPVFGIKWTTTIFHAGVSSSYLDDRHGAECGHMNVVGDTLIKWGLAPRWMRSTSAVSGRRTGEMEEVSVMRLRKRDNSGAGAGRTPVGLGPCRGRLNRLERQRRSFGFAQQARDEACAARWTCSRRPEGKKGAL